MLDMRKKTVAMNFKLIETLKEKVEEAAKIEGTTQKHVINKIIAAAFTEGGIYGKEKRFKKTSRKTS